MYREDLWLRGADVDLGLQLIVTSERGRQLLRIIEIAGDHVISGEHQPPANQKAGGISVRPPVKKRDHTLQSVWVLLGELKLQRDGAAFLLLQDFRGAISETRGGKQAAGRQYKHQAAKGFSHPILLCRIED